MSKFALIVDNEVAGIARFPDSVNGGELPGEMEKSIAIFRSNPTIVEIVDELVEEGYIWNGVSFTAPVE